MDSTSFVHQKTIICRSILYYYFFVFSVPTVNDLFRKRPNEIEPQIKRESPIKLAKYDVEDDEDQLSEEFSAKHYSSKHNI
jgi:hypothetical protein